VFFPKKIPRKCLGSSPGNPPKFREKKVRFFSGFFFIRRKDTAHFCKIRGKKFPGKSGIFREKISAKIPEIPEIPENFRKKSVKNDDFGKIRPSFAERVLKRTFLRS
jgi:hypothetical protein